MIAPSDIPAARQSSTTLTGMPGVATAVVLAFIIEQRTPRRGDNAVRLEDGEAGLSARTIKRRLSSVSGLFSYLIARQDVDVGATRFRAAWRRASPPHGGVVCR